VIYPSKGNFTWNKKKYSFGGQKGENKPSEPRNRIWGSKSIWSCISIDREIYIYMKKIHAYRVGKGENKPSEPKNWIWATKYVYLLIGNFI
jgi:hypothetical protein